ncbi:hypothetical protein QBC33DRAFT_617018 [Phialemonium atrogriseum]|uniref:Aminoglycoside phosphotransferase domain-containing protein n=1 Tax=Phialemonium atrogriseum TaxID=1093897 RepID=A0AAJ0C7W2_9PEZI|nr:uncharacterized protein QBC33DRAFT_617018 [Phialemonium atrogriseum]KAK1770613.1 hypothetical protein QBC33DRAFT_617018 [Phialemonium atrogriseum]
MAKVTEAGQRRYCEVEGDYFIKGILPVGRVDLIYPAQWPAERIENEHTALDLVREKTNIPVPRALERGFDGEFGHCLKLEWADGIDLGNIVDGRDVGAACLMTPGQDGHASSGRCEQCRAVAMANADLFVREVVYPALEGLSSRQTGLNGIRWPVKTSDEVAGAARLFVLCHGDLSYHNMRVDPATLEVKWLLDWEFAGFLPEEFLRIFSLTRADYGRLFENDERKQRLVGLLE